MGWTCRWTTAISGHVDAGPIAGVIDGSGDITLNAPDTASLTVDTRRAWAGVERTRRTVDSGAMLIELDGTPLLFGVIVAPPDEPKPGRAVYALSGVWSVLDDRLITSRHFGADEADALKTSVWQRADMSWGSICQEIVRTAMDKPGGELPIVFDQPAEPVPDGPSLSLPGWDLGNLKAGEQLRRIADLAAGPDIMFRPRVEAGRVVIGMVHGTHHQPGIGQARTVTWDETAVDTPLVDLQVMTPPAGPPSRAYATGPGSGGGDESDVAIAIADDPTALGLLKVFRERVAAGATGLDSPSLLASIAAGMVRPTGGAQMRATVRLTDRRAVYGPGGWHVGDLVRVVTRERDILPAGAHLMRAVSLRFNVASTLGDVTLEEDAR